MEILIGFRDPNSVAIKDFFEYSTKLNYLAILINDQNPAVRLAFIQHMSYWSTVLEDRFDHHTRLTPYILTGLFDPFDQISVASMECIEKAGKNLEEEKEKEFRDER